MGSWGEIISSCRGRPIDGYVMTHEVEIANTIGDRIQVFEAIVGTAGIVEDRHHVRIRNELVGFIKLESDK